VRLSHPTRRGLFRALAISMISLLVAAIAAPANASSPVRFDVVKLISNQSGAALLDDELVNAWGMSFGPAPNTPLWVSDNGTGRSTVYIGGLNGAAPVKRLSVAVPDGPTGQVFNDTDQFVLGSAKALFIFDNENGDILAWNGGAAATVVKHIDGAVYKGLTLVHTQFGPFLLAANFHDARIDVFDGQFNLVNLPQFFFHDPRLPRGYAPFDVFASGDAVYVSYAKQDAERTDEVAGQGLGFVDKYTNFGLIAHRIATRGTLNAPWGMAIAPASFGRFAGDLLVGNFGGDGNIGVYAGSHFRGLLRDTHNHRIAIDGLWGLLPGTAATGGTNVVWFSAGPNDENDGLVGQIVPAS